MRTDKHDLPIRVYVINFIKTSHKNANQSVVLLTEVVMQTTVKCLEEE
jgi:hypothetical protein